MDNYDYHYQYYDDYQHSNHLPSMVKTKSGKENRIKQRKHRHKVGEHIVKTIKEENGSPTSGQITVVVVPESTFKEESRQQDRNWNRADHGTDLKYLDSGQPEPEDSYEYKSNDPTEEVDYNDIFDDVIDTTVNPMVGGDLNWEEDMWEEVSRDFSRDSERTSKKPRQKVKVKRQRRRPAVSSTRGTRGTSPPRSVEEANHLSIWAAAERVSEDAPSIRFDDFKHEEDLEDKFNKINSIKDFEFSQTRKTSTRPTTTPEEIEREFYEGFKPSRTDSSQRSGRQTDFKRKLNCSTKKCFCRINNFMAPSYHHDSQQVN